MGKNIEQMSRAVAVVVIVLYWAARPGLADVTLVEDGKAQASIVKLNDEETCAQAAAELQKYIALMSGANLETRSMADWQTAPKRAALCVGTAADLQGEINREMRRRIGELAPEGFVIFCEAKAPRAWIVGKEDAGMMYGVYEFLEKLGCRWYMPAEIGENVPRKKTIVIKDMSDVQNPDFILRSVWWAYSGRPQWQREAYHSWQRKNKMGGVQASMGHNLHRVISPSELGEKHPEYFPLRGGKRYIPRSSGEQGWQPCTSNPEVVKIAVQKAVEYFDRTPSAYSFSLSPADGYGWCECENCTKQDPEEFRGLRNRGKGRRMTIFANEVAKGLALKHPDKYVCWYAYAGTVEAPKDVDVHKNVVISLAHYGWCGCNVHCLRDDRCSLNRNFLKILDDWSSKASKLFIREYWTTLVRPMDGIARICAAYSLAEDIPLFKSKGVIGFSSESIPDYGACALNFWIAAKKMWAADADTESLLDDFYVGMYGPAASNMRGYFESIVKTCRERGDRSSFFTEEDLEGLAVLLDGAAKLCETAKQRARVKLTRDYYDYMMAMRDYAVVPTRAKRDSISQFIDDIEKRRSLAVDFRSHRSSFGRRPSVPTKSLEQYCGAKLRPYTTDPMPKGAENVAFTVRGQHGFVVLLNAGEELRGKVEVRRLGRYLSSCAFAVLDPNKKRVVEGVASIGERGEIKYTAKQAGAHVIVINTGRNAARVYVDNQYFCLVGRRLGFLSAQPKAYFYVLPEAEEAMLTLTSDTTGNPDAPGETAMMVVYDPTGKEAARGDTVSGKAFEATLPAPSKYRGKAWQVLLTKASKGVLEDLRLSLGPGCSEFLATDSSRLLVTGE